MRRMMSPFFTASPSFTRASHTKSRSNRSYTRRATSNPATTPSAFIFISATARDCAGIIDSVVTSPVAMSSSMARSINLSINCS